MYCSLTAPAKAIHRPLPICPVNAPSVSLSMRALAAKTTAKSSQKAIQPAKALRKRVRKSNWFQLTMLSYQRQCTYNLHRPACTEPSEEREEKANRRKARRNSIDDQSACESLDNDVLAIVVEINA